MLRGKSAAAEMHSSAVWKTCCHVTVHPFGRVGSTMIYLFHLAPGIKDKFCMLTLKYPGFQGLPEEQRHVPRMHCEAS